jgi:predicted nucleotidyltransferase
MGTDLNQTTNDTPTNIDIPSAPTPPSVRLIPWLDEETAAAVADITRSVAEHHPEVQAVILFGSVARQEERSLDDPQPSDVDLLLVLDAATLGPMATRLTREQDLALIHTIGEADYRHHAPREIKSLFIHRDLERWDPMFIENVARDGILLWSRASLPTPFAPIAERATHDLVEAQVEAQTAE